MGGPALIGENTYNYKVADTEIYMHPCDKLNELEKIIPQLKQQGVTGVVAGTLASTVAMKYGMKVEMLDTKVPSIKGAIKEAVIS
ncbi:PrpR N-terminal domain-containing protein [Clostridium magnum]|uniref:PrpR N-terminal domain-containing protein n=1 Tax=Clostridium magnum TaxID=33954 RepID=UPI00241D7938|nr:PrpR N-terminal domain-containing protein [Clostridium magnum]